MLCNTIEEGEEKCYQYWPLQKDESAEFAKLKVTLQSEDVHEQYVVRKLHVCNEKVSLSQMHPVWVVTKRIVLVPHYRYFSRGSMNLYCDSELLGNILLCNNTSTCGAIG